MITEKNNVFYCDCGFSFKRGHSGAHDCANGLLNKLAESEARCAELAAENAGMKSASSCLVSEYMMNKGTDSEFIACITPSKKTIGTGGTWDMWRHLDMVLDTTPATDAFLTEVRAQGVEMFAASLGSPYVERGEECYQDGYTHAVERIKSSKAAKFAAQLRKGVQS